MNGDQRRWLDSIIESVAHIAARADNPIWADMHATRDLLFLLDAANGLADRIDVYTTEDMT